MWDSPAYVMFMLILNTVKQCLQKFVNFVVKLPRYEEIVSRAARQIIVEHATYG